MPSASQKIASIATYISVETVYHSRATERSLLQETEAMDTESSLLSLTIPPHVLLVLLPGPNHHHHPPVDSLPCPLLPASLPLAPSPWAPSPKPLYTHAPALISPCLHVLHLPSGLVPEGQELPDRT